MGTVIMLILFRGSDKAHTENKQTVPCLYNKRHGTFAYYPSVFETVRFLNKDNTINASYF